MKILVIQQKMIGDVLTSSILFEVLRQKFPEAELHYLINKNTSPVVENNPYIDKCVIFTPEIKKSKSKYLKFLKTIKKELYDVVIDPYAKLNSALITLFSKAKIKISYEKSYSKLIYTHSFKNKLARTKDIGLAYENRLMLLEPLVENIDYTISPKIYINASEKQNLLVKLHKASVFIDSKTFAMVNVLGSELLKTYPLKSMAGLLDQIVKSHPNLNLLFNYIPTQKEQVETLLSFCSLETLKNISTYYAQSLREFIVLTSFCKMVIGNEGGAINMGKAMDKPTFAIFSPWIRKETWGSSKNDTNNYTVHLRDYKPEMFTNYSQKVFKKKALKLYQAFKPELITKELNAFIKDNL